MKSSGLLLMLLALSLVIFGKAGDQVSPPDCVKDCLPNCKKQTQGSEAACEKGCRLYCKQVNANDADDDIGDFFKQ